MKRIQEIFNFDDVGTKIQTLAKCFCWIMILLTWIGAIICFLLLLFSKAVLFAFLVPIGAILFSILIWIGSWQLYAFGQYVEDIGIIRHQMAKMGNIDRNLQTIVQPMKGETEEKVKGDIKESDKANLDEASVPLTKVQSTQKAQKVSKIAEEAWKCPVCGSVNLASQKNCFSCAAPQPLKEEKEWDSVKSLFF